MPVPGFEHHAYMCSESIRQNSDLSSTNVLSKQKPRLFPGQHPYVSESNATR